MHPAPCAHHRWSDNRLDLQTAITDKINSNDRHNIPSSSHWRRPHDEWGQWRGRGQCDEDIFITAFECAKDTSAITAQAKT